MKTTIKRNLIVFHKLEEWEHISQQLVDEHGFSILISWKMRRELGFQVRYHKGLEPHDKDYAELSGEDYRNRYHYQDQVHLDFFSDSAQSWFQLKYL
jgi:hypothetical protein